MKHNLVPWLLFVFFYGGPAAWAWKRSSLIYHAEQPNPNRIPEQWKRHLMKIDSTGKFTGEWIFDATVLTSMTANGKDIYTGAGLSSADCIILLNNLLADAKAFDSAITSLRSQFGTSPPSVPYPTYIAMPYLSVMNTLNFTLGGHIYDLSVKTNRIGIMKWYLNELKGRLYNNIGGPWPNLKFGVYYHREDAADAFNDVEFIQEFNNYAHSLGYETVWIPYYAAPHAWEGKSLLKFDYNIVQPSYSFLNSIDGGIIHGDKLYSAGTKAASLGQCYEYEIRSQGLDPVENAIAHQYLAIAQFTGCWQFPQAFFVGGPDIFDIVTDKASAQGDRWSAYYDLTEYLTWKQITNMEVGLDWGSSYYLDSNTREMKWTIQAGWYVGLNSIRLDFNDADINNIWRGGVRVLVNGDPKHSSFAQRAGTDNVNPNYNSVFVPISNEMITAGTTLHIQIYKESSSPWPNIIRLIGATFEPKYIANPIFQVTSTSSNTFSTESKYLDSYPAHLNYYPGRLTDGQVSDRTWNWVSAVGWASKNYKRVTITINLGTILPISKVVIKTSSDVFQGVNWPELSTAFVAKYCEPQERGTVDGCLPEAGPKNSVLTQQQLTATRFDGDITLNFEAGVSGKYVTITVATGSFLMIHEVQVFNNVNQIVSNGKPYKVTPKAGIYLDFPPNAENSQLLVDGAVFDRWIFSSQNSVGIVNTDNGKVEATWTTPRTGFKYAVIWLTNADPSAGIILPSSFTIQWRNEFSLWQNGIIVQTLATANCGPSPCAKLALPFTAQVTGVRGVFPRNDSWVIVTEISLGNK